MTKTVIINRAVPGSGKTTISRCIVDDLTNNGLSVSIHSTDEYFMTADGRYDFDVSKLSSYHEQNLSQFTASVEAGVDVVLCDNINLAPWQTEPYTSVARAHGYKIILITFVPRELEKHVLSQKITTDKPDAHEVPEDVLIRFIKEYQDCNALLDKRTPVDTDKYKNFIWNDKECIRVECDTPVVHFDFDHLITIEPDEYHKMKQEIGGMILALHDHYNP